MKAVVRSDGRREASEGGLPGCGSVWRPWRDEGGGGRWHFSGGVIGVEVGGRATLVDEMGRKVVLGVRGKSYEWHREHMYSIVSRASLARDRHGVFVATVDAADVTRGERLSALNNPFEDVPLLTMLADLSPAPARHTVLAVVVRVRQQVLEVTDLSRARATVVLVEPVVAGALVLLCDYELVSATRQLVKGRYHVRAFQWPAATLLRTWWDSYGAGVVAAATAAEQQTAAPPPSRSVAAKRGAGGGGGVAREAPSKRAHVAAGATAELAPEVPDSQDVAFVAADDEGEDEFEQTLVPRQLDAFERGALPALVVQHFDRGKVLYNPSHDGENLRFRWDTRCISSITREIANEEKLSREAKDKLFAELAAFVELDRQRAETC